MLKSQFLTTALVIVVATAAVLAFRFGGVSPSAVAQSRRLTPVPELGTARFREGTKIADAIGTFELAGDRLIFHGQSEKDRFRTLENLALERIMRVISESSGKLHWSVSGTITEFRGNNYLLLERVLLKSELSGAAQ